MPYPTKLLNRNEEIVLDLRPHWWYFGRQILTGVPLFIVLVLFLSWDPGGLGGDVLSVIVIVVVVAWVVWLGIKYLAWARTYFVVTNQRVIYRTGVVSRKGAEIPLDRITNINFNQRIFERMIGAGNLEVQSAGEQGNTTFDFVRHPDGVQQEIYRQMDARERVSRAPMPPRWATPWRRRSRHSNQPRRPRQLHQQPTYPSKSSSSRVFATPATSRRRNSKRRSRSCSGGCSAIAP